jgi:hypothetical protein
MKLKEQNTNNGLHIWGYEKTFAHILIKVVYDI